MNKLRMGLLVILAASSVGLWYQRKQSSDISAYGADLTNRPVPVARPPVPFAKRDNGLEFAIPKGYVPPPSSWVSQERAFYISLLGGKQFDILVVPLQVQAWAFDRTIRSMMTAKLSSAVAAAQNARIPDPYLVSKLFGEDQRQLKQDDIDHVAESLGVKRIVMGYVGHDRMGHLMLTVAVKELGARDGSPSAQPAQVVRKEFSGVIFDALNSPINAFESRLPGVISGLNLGAVQRTGYEENFHTTENKTLDQPAKNRVSDNPESQAYKLLLLAALTPDHIERTRERFVEKAYLLLQKIPPASPSYNALRARVYMSLGFRPIAMQLLATPVSSEDKTLRAILDGDLPLAKELARSEHDRLRRLLAILDVNRMARSYGVAGRGTVDSSLENLRLGNSDWQWLAKRALEEGDDWSQFDNMAVKMALDRDFPVPGYNLKDILGGALSTGGDTRLETDLNISPLNHARKYLESNADTACCQSGAESKPDLDYLELLAAIGNDNVIRRIRFLSTIQGNSKSALAYANEIDAIYAGYPYYVLERAKAERKMADQSGGVERDGLLRKAYEGALNAMYWEQSQSRVSTAALNELGGNPRRDFGYFDNFYSSDIPYRPDYAIWSDGGNRQAMKSNALAALAGATYQFDAAYALLGGEGDMQRDPSTTDDVFKAISGRFKGSPSRNDLTSKYQLLSGNTEAAIETLKESVVLAPDRQQTYFFLGKLLIEDGDLAGGAKVFSSYPGFKQSSKENRVVIANTAYDMGSVFYGMGEIELAKPLYKIAAAQDTGAAAEMEATGRLSLVAGDVNGAMQQSYARARRYNDARAFRDFLGMLHAVKQNEEAWTGFKALVRNLPQPYVWETALVGHHIEGRAEQDVVQWAKLPEFRTAGDKFSYAAAYLARFGTSDRTPSQTLAKEIETLDRPIWQMEEGSHLVVRPTADGREQQILGPVVVNDGHGILPIGVFDNGKKHRIKSDIAYFVEAYRFIKARDFKSAKRTFDESAQLYDMATVTSYMLPYYALVSARVGDLSSVEIALSRFAPDNKRFDYQLARAAIEGLAGKTELALSELNLARYRRAATDERVLITQYTYADICDLLFAMTNRTEFRDVALDWARKRQRVEPSQSWSFALEAKLSQDSVARRKAAAMAFYLDPNSEILSTMKKQEIESAVKEYGKSNIFLKASMPTDRDQST